MGSFETDSAKARDYQEQVEFAFQSQLALATQEEAPTNEQMTGWKKQVMMRYVTKEVLPTKYHSFETLDGDTDALSNALASILTRLRQRDPEEWATFITTAPENIRANIFQQSPFADMFVFVLDPGRWGSSLFRVDEIAAAKGLHLGGKTLFLALPKPQTMTDCIAFGIDID